MKKNKNIKNKKIFGNKYALLIIVVLIAFAVAGVNKIFGQSTTGILQVCKTNGGILMARENCPGGAPAFNLSLVTENGGSGGGNAVGTGYVRFVYKDSALTEDGNIWVHVVDSSTGIGEWHINEGITKLDQTIVNTITYWGGDSFLVSSASGTDYYLLTGNDQQNFISIGLPVKP